MNASGQEILRTSAQAVVNENVQIPTNIATATATQEATATETPTATLEPSPTPTATATETVEPSPTATLEAILGSMVSGTVTLQGRSDVAGVTVQLIGDDGTALDSVMPDASGLYSFSAVAPGTYDVFLAAPQYLSAVQTMTVAVDGTVIELASVTLLAGDTDGNEAIDIDDATFIGANFLIPAPPAPDNADLNKDQMVNISDLVLVGSNFGSSGPTVIEQSASS